MEQMNRSGKTTLWTAVGCITRGRSHVKDNIVCQDRTCILNENGVYAFALADGAGSAALSHYGAETVTKAVCRLLCQNFNDFFQEPSGKTVKEKIVSHLVGELEKTAAYHGCYMKDLASTLLAVAVCKEQYLFLHIGDGVIGYTKNGRIKVASAPKNGEFCNATYFVTSGDAVRMMNIGRGEATGVCGFVLMSDGSEASLYSKQQRALATVLERLVYRLSITSAEFLTPSIQSSLDEVISRQTYDDCSLLIAAKVERTYAELSAEEQNEYFEIQADIVKPRAAKKRRVRYMDILNALTGEKSDSELVKAVGLKDTKRFVKRWLCPLEELGYIVQVRPHIYRRIVGPDIISEAELIGCIMSKEERVQDEEGCGNTH